MNALEPPRHRRGLNLRAKITGLLVFYFFVALVAIGSTLSISWQLEGSAAAINDAGSERMRSYRIAYLLALYARTPAPALRGEVEREISRFEKVIIDLERGDPERPLSLPDTPEIRAHMMQLHQAWAVRIKPQMLRILAAGPGDGTATLLAGFHDDLQNFVAIVNDLVVMIEASNAHATILLRTFQIGLVTLALLGTVLLVYLFSLMVIDPVSRLEVGLRRMGAADFGTRLPVGSHDELGALAGGFNQMAAHLQDLYATLEQRVAEKTRSIETKSRELAALYDVAACLNSATGAPLLCDQVLEKMVVLFEADAGVVRLADATGTRLSIVAARGRLPEFLAAEGAQDIGTCLCGQAAATGVSLNCTLAAAAAGAATHACARTGCGAVVAVTIRAKRRLLGLLTLVFADARAVPEGEVRLLEAVGQHLGIAIDNQRLFAREKEMAVSEERNLLAQELHDSIAQSLAFLNIQVQLLKDALAEDKMAEARDGLAQIHEGVQECYDDVRELLVHFRTRVENADLETALRSALEKFGAQTGIRACFARSGRAAELPPERVLQVLHIAQEALSNVRKHARADAVEMTLDCEPERCTLTIDDNGRGFDATAVAGDTHVGLRIMRERAQRIGGSLDIRSAPDRGTRVRIALNPGEFASKRRVNA